MGRAGGAATAVAPAPAGATTRTQPTAARASTCSWAGGGRARLRHGGGAALAAGRGGPAPAAAPARRSSPRAALVNKKGAGAEESLGIPSAPAESELVPGDIPSPPAAKEADAPAARTSRRSKKGGGGAAAAGRAPVSLPSLTSLKAPPPSEEGATKDAEAAMEKRAAEAVKELKAVPAAAEADAEGEGGKVAEAKAFLAAVRGEFAVVDWPEQQRVVQILGFVIASMVFTSGGIYAVDKVFMRLSSIVFGTEY